MLHTPIAAGIVESSLSPSLPVALFLAASSTRADKLRSELIFASLPRIGIFQYFAVVR